MSVWGVASSRLSIPFANIAHRKRAPYAGIALLAFLVLASFAILSFNPTLGLSPQMERPGVAKFHMPIRPPGFENSNYRRPQANAANHRSSSQGTSHSVVFTPEQELAALSYFITSLPSNALPQTVDPSQPIDPELIVDFDVRRNRDEVMRELRVLEKNVWDMYPVIVYAKV